MKKAAAAPEIHRHVVSALVVDRPGTLNRVAGLLRARSFNIESLTVGSTHETGLSRMTIVFRGDEGHVHQVLAQLNRLIEVLEVTDLTHADFVELEVALVELDPPAEAGVRDMVRRAIETAGGELLETDHTWRARLTAPPEAVETALAALRGAGLRALVRAGSVAMATPHPRDNAHPAHSEGATA